MPVADWATQERRKTQQEETPQEEYARFFSSLTVPAPVAAVTYPRGCRIRRVRVRTLEQPTEAMPEKTRKPLIVSRRALQETRNQTQADR
jgi:hypothetical protein